MDRKILIVDDEPSSRQMLKKFVSAAGYQPLSATNGKEALDIIRNEDVQLILTDWMMPEMNGIDLCRAVRSFEGIGFVYIIILAAHSDKERVIQAFEAGADDYLSKPFHRGELVVRVKACIRIIDLEANLEKKNRQILKVNAEMVVLNRKLQEMATTDELTGLSNRREAWTQLGNYWATAERHGNPLSCLMIDFDKFKSINDFYGHSVGDVVLRKTAELIKSNTRAGDIVFRIGGEELLILCPHSPASKIAILAERIRKAVEDNIITHDNQELGITISIGIAERSKVMSTPDHLLMMADKALYAAKNAGRNRVCLAPGTSAEEKDENKSAETYRR